MCFLRFRFLFLLFLFLGCRVDYSGKYQYKLPLILDSRNVHQEMIKLKSRLQQDPQNSIYKIEFAEVLYVLGKKTGMEENYDKSLELLKNSSHPNSKLIVAKIKEARHQFSEAIELAQNVLIQAPHSRQALNILATSHLALGDFSKAIQSANALVALFPRTSTLSLRGLILLSMGREDEGVYELERAIAIEDIGELSESSWARCILARHFLSRARLKEAEFLLDEALRITPQSPFALDLKAQLLAHQGKIQQAENLFEKAFRESRDIVHLRHHAELNAQNDKHQLAMDRWSQVEKLIRQELSQGRADHRLELVKVLLMRKENKDVEESLILLSEEMKTRKTAEIFYLTALAYVHSNQLKLSYEAIEQALANDEVCPEYYRLSALIQKKLGNEGKVNLYEGLAKKLNSHVNEQLSFL